MHAIEQLLLLYGTEEMLMDDDNRNICFFNTLVTYGDYSIITSDEDTFAKLNLEQVMHGKRQ